MLRLRVHPAARSELKEAALYLDAQREGYGSLLRQEYSSRVDQARRLPKSGRRVSGYAAEHDVRRFVLKRFSYVVVTAVVRGHRTVIAFAHMKRRPGYWRDRLEDA